MGDATLGSALSFTVPGLPVAKARPRVVRTKAGGMRAFTPEKSRSFEALVRDAAVLELRARDGWLLLEDPIRLVVEAYWPALASGPARLRVERPKGSRPDADNVAKAVMDALNGVIWRDDSLVAELVVRKRHAAPGVGARTDVRIEALP